jgi:hypothetical protein
MHLNTLNLTMRVDYTSLLPVNSVLRSALFHNGDYFDYMYVADSKNKEYWKRFNAYGDQISFNQVTGAYEIDKNADNTPEYTFSGWTDFNYKQFRSNFVIRWEYLTGSTLFLVWSLGTPITNCSRISTSLRIHAPCSMASATMSS